MKSKRRALRIAQLAPLWIPVPPRTYGGIELVVSNLTEELMRRGHKVTLFASGDSKTSADLISPIPRGLWLEKGLRSPHAAITLMLQAVKERVSSFDILHNHFNFFTFPLALCAELPPMLSTIHRPIDELYAKAMKLFPSFYFSTLSEDAKRSAEEHNIPVLDVVPNGIDPEQYPFNDHPENYLLYLGRLNREKGVVTAIEVAKEAGEKLIVAGNVVGAEEWSFFMQEVQPRLNEEHVQFMGQVGFTKKIELLKNAKALLFPIDRREPFGLIMVEAMACGTPVIATRMGAVPEIVLHGETGYVVDTREEMIDAIRRIDDIDRVTCRKHVEEHFTLDLMVTRYENLYERITT